MTRRPLVLALAATAALVGCRGRPSLGPGLRCQGCNLLVVQLTNLRKGHLAAYGYARPTTPRTDEFFADSITLDSAFAPTSWTLPVLASLYTSVEPREHGVMDRYETSHLAPGYVTLAEVLRQAGYTTASLTGDGDHSRRFGVAQGFDYYMDGQNYAGAGLPAASLPYAPLDPLVPLAVRWLEEHERERFFLVLQGYNVHCPFDPSPPFDVAFGAGYSGGVDFRHCLWTLERAEWQEGRLGPVRVMGGEQRELSLTARDLEQMRALYDGEILEADAALAPLWRAIEELDLAERTIVVFMSEHGDLLGEHGRVMRGGPLRGTFYDEVLGFPWRMRHPAAHAARRVAALAQTTDLLPTYLDLLGVADPAASERDGTSLRPLLEGGEAAIHTQLYAGARFRACQPAPFGGLSVVDALRDSRWKLIRQRSYDAESGAAGRTDVELYDVARDPREESDRALEQPAVVAEMLAALDRRWPAPVTADTLCAAPPAAGSGGVK